MIQAIVSAVTETLTSFGAGVASFLNSFITELIFVTDGDTTKLTAFASWSLAFLGLGLVLGLGAFIVNLCKRKG